MEKLIYFCQLNVFINELWPQEKDTGTCPKVHGENYPRAHVEGSDRIAHWWQRRRMPGAWMSCFSDTEASLEHAKSGKKWQEEMDLQGKKEGRLQSCSVPPILSPPVTSSFPVILLCFSHTRNHYLFGPMRLIQPFPPALTMGLNMTLEGRPCRSVLYQVMAAWAPYGPQLSAFVQDGAALWASLSCQGTGIPWPAATGFPSVAGGMTSSGKAFWSLLPGWWGHPSLVLQPYWVQSAVPACVHMCSPRGSPMKTHTWTPIRGFRVWCNVDTGYKFTNRHRSFLKDFTVLLSLGDNDPEKFDTKLIIVLKIFCYWEKGSNHMTFLLIKYGQ